MAHRRSLVIGVVVALAVLGVAGTAQASDNSGKGSGGTRVIEVQDDCTTSFNDFIGAEVCNPAFDGNTSIQDFIKELNAKGSVGHWRFHPDSTTVALSGSLTPVVDGGEFHTFARVQHFGGGCLTVADTNGIDLNQGKPPVPECQDPNIFATGIVAGSHLTVTRNGVTTDLTENGQPQFLGPVSQEFPQKLMPGTNRFQCLIHPWMRTTVYVGGA
jgi:hypothetical protein